MPLSAALRRMTLRRHQPIAATAFALITESTVYFLTQIEYRILELLTRHAGRVLTYDYIIKSVWGASASFDKQILRVNMANIRKKLESNPAAPKYLKTEIGVGYWIKEEE